jgi:hypothetical protein
MLILFQTIPNYLAFVLEYAKYNFTGSLVGDNNEINTRIDYEYKNIGITKRFSFKDSYGRDISNFLDV